MGAEAADRAREMILAAKKKAAEHAQNIKDDPCLSQESAQREVKGYILARFHLSEEDCATDSFRELANISLAKSMRVSKELVAEFDLARSCSGVTSVTAKMVLLFMALQRDLGVRLDPLETAQAETVRDIAVLVWRALKREP